jgi:hypothetical protein
MSRPKTLWGVFVATLVVLLLACILPAEKQAGARRARVETKGGK